VYGRFLDGSADRGPLSAGMIRDIAERQRSFAHLGASVAGPRETVYTGDEGSEVVRLLWLEPALQQTLGVPTALGRGFTEEEAKPDTVQVVMLSHAVWQQRFAGDPGVLGRVVRLNDLPRTVIGVMPRGFIAPVGEADFYFPLNIEPALRDPISARGSHWLGLVGRLKAGVTLETAKAELASIAEDLAREYPRDNASIRLAAVPVREAMVGDTRTPLLVLLASAALVLLIACANLAGALLSRTISRRKEFAVRISLGAGRSRLIRQLLTETTLLALIGGAAGLLLAGVGLGLLRGLASTALPSYAELSLDGGAVLVTFVLALCTGLAFGVGPALSVGNADPQGALRDETRGTSEGRRARKMRGALVAGQVALCLSLLTGAGLLARSLWAMASAPLGFNPDGLLSVTIPVPNSRYGTPELLVAFQDQFGERLRALPGVSGVAVTSFLPTRVENRNGFIIDGAPWPASDAMPFVLTDRVSEDYFRVFGIPVRSGRTFAPTDHLESPPVVVITESMARRYWPAGDAIGARIRMGPNPNAPLMEVVGIVGDVRNDLAQAQAEPMVYVSLRQGPFADKFVLRTAGDPLALVTAVRRQLKAFDAELPLHDVTTMRAVLGEGLANRKLPVLLMAAFGALALLLAALGVYAMFANMAAAQEREFGVRMALGSSRSAIAGLVLRQGAVWMTLGLAGGALGVMVVARLMRNLIYGISPLDPVALVVAVLTLLGCATVALLIPVRRATRVDPARVLH
jgi:putative ABC transport system permease protein